MTVRTRRPNGQGLLEVIVSFAILGIGLGGSLQLILSGGVQNRRTELQTQAANFAREGLEVMRSIRDSNWLAGRTFDVGLWNPGEATDFDGTTVFNPASGGWSVSFVPDPATSVPTEFDTAGSSSIIKVLNSAYVQGTAPGSGTVTQFRRIFYARSICTDINGNESTIASGTCGALTKIGVAAVVRVEWKDRGKRSVVSVQENFYDWRL